jgi:hypothetical protein
LHKYYTMQTEAKALLTELAEITEASTITAKQLRSLSAAQLNYKTDPESWSILECIEHLNLYGNFYLPEIEKQILAQKGHAPGTIFKSGILGNYFAELMRGKNGQIKKMKSPKDKNPVHSRLSVTTIERFIKQQERLLGILRLAGSVDLTRTKTAISLTKLIKLRLGDTLRFFIYHIERHIAQARKVQSGIPAALSAV